MSKSTTPVVPLTQARTALFRLAEALLSGDVEQVRLSHRNHADDLVLLRASTLQALEQQLASLTSRLVPAPRPLAGLASLHLARDEALDDLLAASRTEAQALFEDKVDKLSHELAPRSPTAKPRRVAESTPARGYQGRARGK